MSFKDILAMLVAEDNAGVINCAQRVAQRVGGAASALLFEVEPAPIYVYGSYEGYVSGDLWQKVVAEARTAFLDSERKVKAQLTALPQEISLEERHVLAMEVAAQAALAARYRDLIVMARPDAAMSAAQRGRFCWRRRAGRPAPSAARSLWAGTPSAKPPRHCPRRRR